MCTKPGSILTLIISIFTLYYLICISSDTKIDTFQIPFKEGEKEELFHSLNKNPIIESLENSLKCELYKDSIMNPKVKKLGDVFNINIALIHQRSTYLIIIYAAVIISVVLFILFIAISAKYKNLYFACLSCCLIIASIALAIINVILMTKFFILLYKSDVAAFIEFLSCKNVNREAFSSHLYVEDLEYHFIRFIIFGILSFLLNTRNNDNENKREQTNNNSNDIELVDN